jgi:hypothetical protein
MELAPVYDLSAVNQRHFRNFQFLVQRDSSAQAGPRIVAILSVVESCRRLRLPIRDYLAAVLPGLANHSIHSLDKLTPTAAATSQ